MSVSECACEDVMVCVSECTCEGVRVCVSAYVKVCECVWVRMHVKM